VELAMKLLCDDLDQIYVWVDDQDENIELSPHFDYEEDAIQWRERMKKELHE
jgi:hypothetical protein